LAHTDFHQVDHCRAICKEVCTFSACGFDSDRQAGRTAIGEIAHRSTFLVVANGFDRSDDTGISSTAAEVAAHVIANFGSVRGVALIDQGAWPTGSDRVCNSRIEKRHARHKDFLSRVKIAFDISQAFDCDDFRSVDCNRQRGTRNYTAAIQQHLASTALSLIAAEFRACQAQVVTQCFDQCRSWFNGDEPDLDIRRQGDFRQIANGCKRISLMSCDFAGAQPNRRTDSAG